MVGPWPFGPWRCWPGRLFSWRMILTSLATLAQSIAGGAAWPWASAGVPLLPAVGMVLAAMPQFAACQRLLPWPWPWPWRLWRLAPPGLLWSGFANKGGRKGLWRRCAASRSSGRWADPATAPAPSDDRATAASWPRPWGQGAFGGGIGVPPWGRG